MLKLSDEDVTENNQEGAGSVLFFFAIFAFRLEQQLGVQEPESIIGMVCVEAFFVEAFCVGINKLQQDWLPFHHDLGIHNCSINLL